MTATSIDLTVAAWPGIESRLLRQGTEDYTELGLPGGNIFHRDLAWPFAEHEDEARDLRA